MLEGPRRVLEVLIDFRLRAARYHVRRSVYAGRVALAKGRRKMSSCSLGDYELSACVRRMSQDFIGFVHRCKPSIDTGISGSQTLLHEDKAGLARRPHNYS